VSQVVRLPAQLGVALRSRPLRCTIHSLDRLLAALGVELVLQQRQQQRFPHLGQRVGSASAAGLGSFGLQAAAAATSWRLPAHGLDMYSAICCVVRGAGMTRCPAHGIRFQQTPARAVHQIGATPQPDCRREALTPRSGDSPA
jgi:hypothetical protein